MTESNQSLAAVRPRQPPDPERSVRRSGALRRQRPGGGLPADPGDSPAQGRAERAGRPHRRRRLRRLQRLRRPDQHAHRGAPGGQRPQVHPLPHHRALLADAGGAADRAQPPLGRHGRHHRAGHRRPRLHLDDPQHQGGRGQDAARQRLLHRPVRQVPRGAGLGDQPDGAVRPLADDAGLREVLRLHRRRDQPVVPRGLRRPHPRRGAERSLLPLHRGHGRQGDRLDQGAEGDLPGQAVLHLLGARRHPRPAPGARGVDREVQGAVRRRLGRAARADLRPPEGAGRHPRRCRADAAPGADPGLGRHAGGAASRSCAARWRPTPGSWSTPTTSVGRLVDAARSRPRSSTTPSSTTSSATTAPRPKGRSTAPSTR